MSAGSSEVLQAMLASLWRRKLLVGAIVATTVVTGIITVAAMPPSYKAEAYIRGGFSALDAVSKDAKDEETKNAPSISLDLSRVIETQARLLQSQDLARRVVQQIGIERLRPELGGSLLLPTSFYTSAANTEEDKIDRAAAQLLRGFSVSTDPRTYMIEVSYTARDPELAAVITNGFVTEFLRASRLQTLSLKRSLAAATLSQQLAIFGDKHPKAIKAKMRLAAADEQLKSQLGESPDAIRQNVGENVTMAIAAPAKPKMPLVIGLLLLVGLSLGAAAALWLERQRWADGFLRFYNRPFA
jgi:uncharacterized protein involved in exopolysaccharide biosynthesis